MSKGSILITGCSSGIGLAAARVMKARGWRVLATARKDEDLARLEMDVGVEALPLELTDPASIETCAGEALERTHGNLDAVFSNAGFGQLGAVEDVGTDALRAQFEVNFFGVHDLTRRLIPAMRRQGFGRIVQCSSVLGFVSGPYRGAYCASKFALEALTDSLRMELRGTGIHVSLIEPGPIASRFIENAVLAFRANIDIAGSVHHEIYQQRLALLEAGGKQTFKLEPEAVARKLIHATESRRPKPRYFVTVPTYLLAAMKRALPGRMLDAVASRF